MNQYRDDMNRAGKEVGFTLGKLLKWGIVTIVVLFLLGWLAQSLGIVSMNIEREKIQHSQQYTETKAALLDKLYNDHLTLDSEIAGGMYVFGVCGGDYTVVCKNLEYRFLRPCFGPAEYRIVPKDDIHALVEEGGEFNITIDMDIVQILPTMVGDRVSREMKKERRRKRRVEARAAETGSRSRAERLERLKNREKRVGRASATFHVTPKAHHKERAQRREAARDTGE